MAPETCAAALKSPTDDKNKTDDWMTTIHDTPAPPRTTALPTVNARIYPRGGLDILSRDEVARLRDASRGGMHDLLRRCTLAVLTTGSTPDDPRAAQALSPDFDIEVRHNDRGLPIHLTTPPAPPSLHGRPHPRAP